MTRMHLIGACFCLVLLSDASIADVPPLLPVYRRALAPDEDPLSAPVASFRASRTPLASALVALGRGYGVTFVLDPGLKGEVSLEVSKGTLRDALDALTLSQGLYWERRDGLVAIHRNVTRFYEIDYPQMTRSAQGTSTVVLSAQAGSALGAAGNPLAGQGQAGSLLPNDQTNISIQQQNQTTFWTDVQLELSALALPGESAAVNKLAGLAIVTAPPARQREFMALVDAIDRRISRQVRISARVIEVDLNSQNQLGIDWSLAAASAGGLSLSGLSTSTAFSAIGGQTLSPSTVTGTISTGKVSAVIDALRDQGEVRAVSNPSVVSLNNQTAFVKVGTEQTFFSLSNSTTINQPGATVPFTSTQSNYSQNSITIGTVLYVTPEVNRDGTVTVDVLPAITQLIGIDTSPDKQQTAPRMDIKSLSTIARVRPGESIMIGGLIYNETDKRSRKVPGLGDLPWVGAAFGTSASVSVRSELVIFLTVEPLP